jgi:hypothetical protein
VVMVVALSAQPLYGSISYLNYSSNLGVAVREAEAIKKAALSAFMGGPGNVRKVAVRLSDGPDSFSIRLGGSEGQSGCHTIDLLWHGQTAANLLLDGLGLSIVTPDKEGIVIVGSQELLLTCIAGNQGDVIIAEVI